MANSNLQQPFVSNALVFGIQGQRRRPMTRETMMQGGGGREEGNQIAYIPTICFTVLLFLKEFSVFPASVVQTLQQCT